jgi:hypothetical protein
MHVDTPCFIFHAVNYPSQGLIDRNCIIDWYISWTVIFLTKKETFLYLSIEDVYAFFLCLKSWYSITILS